MEKSQTLRQFLLGDVAAARGKLSAAELEKLIARGNDIYRKNPLPPTDKIMEVFSRLSKAWADPMYHRRKLAFGILSATSGLSNELLKLVFNEFPRIISPEALSRKIEGELGALSIQDSPVMQNSTGKKILYRPAGQVLHVASGNVFLACIDSLVDGIITKNINYLKMSTDDRDFPMIFAESIKEFDKENIISPRVAVIWWEGGDSSTESIFKRSMDRIVFWGGYDALMNWQKGLGQSTILVRHGPKISFGVVSKEGLAKANLAELSDRIAFDVSIWEQRACNCPQMLFVEESVPDATMTAFIDALTESFEKMQRQFPPPDKAEDECVEVLKTRELAVARQFIKNTSIMVKGPKSLDWTIVYEDKVKDYDLELSPLNRTILIKRYQSLPKICEFFKDQSFYLQTVGYCLENSQIATYAIELSRLGVTRVCPFGVMAIPVPGTPHDGGYALRDLTRATSVE